MLVSRFKFGIYIYIKDIINMFTFICFSFIQTKGKECFFLTCYTILFLENNMDSLSNL